MSDLATAKFSLKDHLFNHARVEYLASLFHGADRRFDAKGFVREAMLRLTQLELKQRISHLAKVLERHLDGDFRIAAKQILVALPAPLDPTLTDDDFGDFIFAPLGEFVVNQGLSAKYLKLSLATLKEITQRFSMEYAIRAFINAHPEQTMAELVKWSRDENYHVRRLVSEGTRPRLPWASRLSIDVEMPIQLLNSLHTDPTRYVTRSVANHLNDISKTRPELVLQTLERWRQAGLQRETELKWMTQHALRTLVKRGDPKALKFLGFAGSPKIAVTEFRLFPKRLSPGEAFEFSFTITAGRAERLVIDYEIDFVRAGSKRSQKVHKLKTVQMSAGETAEFSKRHPLRANATTYSLYPGTHHVTLLINGQPYGKGSFQLVLR